MAYMSQEKKAKIAPVVKAILAKYGVKGSLSVNNHSTLVLTLSEGKLDFIGNANEIIAPSDRYDRGYMQVNHYWYRDHFSGKVRDFLQEVIHAMNDGNHDNSRIEIDYFDVGWYVNINVGRWNKPYKLLEEKAA